MILMVEIDTAQHGRGAEYESNLGKIRMGLAADDSAVGFQVLESIAWMGPEAAAELGKSLLAGAINIGWRP